MAISNTNGFDWQNGDTVTPSRLNQMQAQLKLNALALSLLGTSSGDGPVQEIAYTLAGLALLQAATAVAQRTALGLGTAATQSIGAFEVAGAGAAARAASQPVNAGLTAIALLATTAYGRSLLTVASPAALLAAFSLGTASTQNIGDFDPAGAAAAAQAASQPVDADLTAIAALATTAFGRALLTAADAAAIKATLGLGTAAGNNTGDFDATGAAAAAQAASQPVDSDLTAIAALATTTFGRALLTAADAAALRTAGGIGSMATRAVSISTGTPSGGSDGDVWLQYTP